jgi:hypothetical protein
VKHNGVKRTEEKNVWFLFKSEKTITNAARDDVTTSLPRSLSCESLKKVGGIIACVLSLSSLFGFFKGADKHFFLVMFLLKQ